MKKKKLHLFVALVLHVLNRNINLSQFSCGYIKEFMVYMPFKHWSWFLNHFVFSASIFTLYIYYNNQYSISEFLSRSSMQTFLHCLLIFLINNHHSFYLVILHCIQHEHHQESGLDSFTHFVIWSAAIDYSKSFVSTYIKYIVADSSKLWSKSLLGSCPTAICRWTNKQTLLITKMKKENHRYDLFIKKNKKKFFPS